jgi:hypothetical protein
VKGDIVEANAALHPRRHFQRVLGRADDGPRLEQLAQAFHGAGRTLHLAPHLGQRGGRCAYKGGIHQKLRELTAGHRADDDLARTQPQNKGNPAEHQHDAYGGQGGAHFGAAYGGGETGFHRLAIALALQLLHGEGLNGLDGVQGLVRQSTGVRDAILRGAGQTAHAPAGDDERGDDHRNQDENDAHELGAGESHQHDRAHQAQRRAQDNG